VETVRAAQLITPALLQRIRQHFRLDWHGIHGAAHWTRVRRNGLRLARETGARTDVVELFAFLHDCCRVGDGRDGGHGARAAGLVYALSGDVISLDDTGTEALAFACRHHSDGLIDADATVQTCWDADRLDLGRVGVIPDARQLGTATARCLALSVHLGPKLDGQ
jgi:uncharacterized protein